MFACLLVAVSCNVRVGASISSCPSEQDRWVYSASIHSVGFLFRPRAMRLQTAFRVCYPLQDALERSLPGAISRELHRLVRPNANACGLPNAAPAIHHSASTIEPGALRIGSAQLAMRAAGPEPFCLLPRASDTPSTSAFLAGTVPSKHRCTRVVVTVDQDTVGPAVSTRMLR